MCDGVGDGVDCSSGGLRRASADSTRGVPNKQSCQFIALFSAKQSPPLATIQVRQYPSCMGGDAMAYDADSIIQLQREVRLRQQHVAAVRSAHEQIIPKIEMLVGAWYLDQFGNRTREIKARD